MSMRDPVSAIVCARHADAGQERRQLLAQGAEAPANALADGAVEVLAKPGGPYSVGDLKNDLPRKIRAASRARIAAARATPPAVTPKPAPGRPMPALHPASRSASE